MNTRIKELRNNTGLTQEAFGNRIGIAKNTIANYENGNRTPSNAVIMSICKEFSVNEEWLKNGIGNKWNEAGDDFTKIAATIDRGDPEIRQLIIDYANLPENDKNLFKEFMHRFIKK